MKKDLYKLDVNEMLLSVKESSKILKLIEESINDTINDWNTTEISSEPDLSGSFRTNLKNKFSQFLKQYSPIDKSHKILFRIDIVRGLGPGAIEKPLGCDFCFILQESIGDLIQYTKIILIQSKKEPDPIQIQFPTIPKAKVCSLKKSNEMTRLLGQVEKMQKITNQNFVLVYSKLGFYILRGDSIRHNIGSNLNVLKFSEFFKLYIDCIIGHYIDEKGGKAIQDFLTQEKGVADSNDELLLKILSADYVVGLSIKK